MRAMERGETGIGARFPIRFLSLTLILTGGAIAWLIWGTYRTYEVMDRAGAKNLRIEELRGTIVHLDEALTMSALMAGESGEARWEERYRRFEPQLDAAIREAVAIAPESYGGESSARTDAANRELVALEDRAFRLIREGRRDEARALLRGEAYAAQKRIYAEGMAQFADGLRRAAAEASRRAKDLAYFNLGVGLATLPFLLAGWLVVSRILARWRSLVDASHRQLRRQTDDLATLVRRVQQSGSQAAASTAQLLASHRQLEAMAGRQAESTQSVVAAATQIAAKSEELKRTVEGLASASDQAATSAREDRAAIARMGTTMDGMVAAAGAIADLLATIRTKAESITAVIAAITSVADQTNLLSLNAAIEAEKAGQAGRGFSVVAREIRRLADRTAESTVDIEASVQEVGAAVAAGAKGTDRFTHQIRQGADEMRAMGDQLASIIAKVQDVTAQLDAVRDGVLEQSRGAGHIRDAMIQLNDMARQTADALNESQLAIESLNTEIRDLVAEASPFGTTGPITSLAGASAGRPS